MRVGGVLSIWKLRNHISRIDGISIGNGQTYGTVMCDKKDGHIDMTAHISPQKQKLNPGLRKTVSFTKNQINQPRHTQTRRRKHKPRKPQTNSQATNPSSFLSGRPSENRGDFRQEIETANMCIDVIQQNPGQALVTKILFSSRTPLSPSKHLRIRRLGSEQTAVGGTFNFRQESFCWATVFPIRCSLQRASPILNFRTEQSCKDESASPTTWSPVQNTCGFSSRNRKSLDSVFVTNSWRANLFTDEKILVVCVIPKQIR